MSGAEAPSSAFFSSYSLAMAFSMAALPLLLVGFFDGNFLRILS